MEMVIRTAHPDLPIPKYEKAIRTSLFSGRADAIHQKLVIEYEKPKSLRSPAKVADALQQVYDYITGLTRRETFTGAVSESGGGLGRDEEEKLSSVVGLVTDGEKFIFVQRRRRQWHTETRRLDTDTLERLQRWLRAMVRKDLSPENLIADFGPQTELAAQAIGVLARLVATGAHPKANVIYEEWKRIFGIVYGVDQLHRTRRDPESQALAAAYRLELGVDFPVLLFSLHTYYALLMKLLATEVIVAQGGLGSTFLGQLTSSDLREQLRSLESGEVLQRYNIRNAIDQDFFGWYPEAWSKELQSVLWRFIQTLNEYDIGTFELRPERTRDLLKDLYHGLIPESIRHALGEYYTPDWLAEHTLDLAGYDGDPEKTLLDPSCGSGTFLVIAIHRIRQWLADRTVEWGSIEKKQEAVQLIRRNIVGFDLNPLAIIAARTNYLFALGPLLRYRERGPEFEIPVYLTDSVLLPARATAQAMLFAKETVAFPMTVGTFNIPTEVVDNHRVPDLMNLLHESIAEGHDVASFVSRSIDSLSLARTEDMETALVTLFQMMQKLDRQGKNRIWAKLIRNRYAALFFQEYFDFVVGNPPHVNWESLTPEWRKAAEPTYRGYGLFTLSGLESRHGGGKKDIAALFTYAVMDHFVKKGGVLALIVHVSLFKTSGAGEGFRRFRLGDKEPFAVQEAHDFKSFQPFQTHPGMKIKTRTLTFRAVRGQETAYPIPYRVWSKTTRGFIPGHLSWAEAKDRLANEEKIAVPLRGTSHEGRKSPWLTIRKEQLPECKKLIAPMNYKPTYGAHAGIYTGGLNGAYFLKIVKRNPNGTLLVRNMHDTGKIECPRVEATIEVDLVYPLLRGRSVGRWHFAPEDHVLILQDPETQKGYEVAWLQRTHPLTWAYIRKFEKLLRERKAFKKFFDERKDAFYSMYAVGEYTFAPHKVVWMDISATVKATVISTPSRKTMPIPEHTVIFAATASEDEAHYLAAALNSDAVGMVVEGYIVDNHLSTHPVENIRLPMYDAKDRLHRELAELSQQAHAVASRGDDTAVRKIEAAINRRVIALWK